MLTLQKLHAKVQRNLRAKPRKMYKLQRLQSSLRTALFLESRLWLSPRICPQAERAASKAAAARIDRPTFCIAGFCESGVITMKLDRRQAIRTLSAGLLAAMCGAVSPHRNSFRRWAKTSSLWPGASSSLRGSRSQQYQTPEWYRDAKFGIWAHWGAAVRPEQGDWYARNMYVQGVPTTSFHLEHYGHPSQFGFKDVIHEWKAENWDPDKLIAPLQARRCASTSSPWPTTTTISTTSTASISRGTRSGSARRRT